jgi:hypothetical protein
MDKTKREELAQQFNQHAAAKNKELWETQPYHHYPITAKWVIAWLDANGYLRDRPNFDPIELNEWLEKKAGG